MRSLVVGAAGYIGAAVTASLSRAGHTVVGIGGPFSVSGRTSFAYSPGIYTALQQELAALDLVVYVAGRVVPSTNVAPNEAIKLDVLPLGELLESLALCRRQPTFVLVSSAGAVYGPAPSDSVLTEASPLAPVSVYGLVRAAMEQLVGLAQRTKQVKAVTLRLSNVFGPGQRVNGPAAFIVRALTAAKSGVPMELWGSGQQRKDFIFIDDVVGAVEAGIRLAAGKYDPSAPNTFNVCHGGSHSLLEILGLIGRIAGREVPYQTIAARDSDVQRVELSPQRAAELLGWRAGVRLEDGLRHCWEAMQHLPGSAQ